MPEFGLRIHKIFAVKHESPIDYVLAGLTLVDVDCPGRYATVHRDPALLRWHDFGCDRFGRLEFVGRDNWVH